MAQSRTNPYRNSFFRRLVAPLAGFGIAAATLAATGGTTAGAEPSAAASVTTSVTCVAAGLLAAPPPTVPTLKAAETTGPGANPLGPNRTTYLCPVGKVPVASQAIAPRSAAASADAARDQATAVKGNPTAALAGPAAQAASTDAAAACAGRPYASTCYYYGGAYAYRNGAGAGANLTVERPTEVPDGQSGHTLAEIAVQGGSGYGDIIEIGWSVSSGQYRDNTPHLFVFSWVGNVPGCYDACGWKQYSRRYVPGGSINDIVGRAVYSGIQYYQGNWWIWFDKEWLGYFPGSRWSGRYTQSSLVQWFGEVATSRGVPPRSDMGNGQFANAAGTSARFGRACDIPSGTATCLFRRNLPTTSAATPRYYTASLFGDGWGQVGYGGPGE